MGLINLLGRAGTSFVGGAASQLNVGFEATREKEAGIAAAKAKAEGEKANIELEARLKRKEAQRVEAVEKEQRDAAISMSYDTATMELSALNNMNNLKQQGYIGFDKDGYASVKLVDVDNDKYWTLDEVTEFAKNANTDLTKKGFIQIPTLRPDGKGYQLETKKFETLTPDGATFKTVAEAQAYATKQRNYYDGIGANMVPIFKPASQGQISVEFTEATKTSKQSQLFPNTPEGEDLAKAYAERQLQWYESQTEFAGKFYPVYETTDDGITVKIQRNDGKDGNGKVAKSADGYDLDVNYLLKKSVKVGPDLPKGGYLGAAAISLTGNKLDMTGGIQETYVEGTDHLVVRTKGVGENDSERVSSFARFIQEDFTVENIKKITKNFNERPNSVGAQRAHRIMVTTFEKFIKDFPNANTLVAPDVILQKDIGEEYPWLAELAKHNPELSKLIKQTPISPQAPPESTAEVVSNSPVRRTDAGFERLIPANQDTSPFIMPEAEDGTRNFTPTFLSRVTTLSKRTGGDVDEFEIAKMVHLAVDENTGMTTRESQQKGLDNIYSIADVLDPKKFTTSTGGYQDPGLVTDTQRDILDLLRVYPTTNDKVIALSVALPDMTLRQAGMNVLASKNPSKEGKYTAVTGGATKYTVVGEQLDNAKNMKGSITGLRKAIAAGGETGLVLEAESLYTGAKYLFDTVVQNIEWEDASVGQRVTQQLQADLQEAHSLTGDERANAMVRVYATMLSYQVARMMDPNGRLSDEDRQTVESAIGLKGIKATPEKLELVAQALEGQVEYLMARNTAYQSGNARRIMAAHLYDQMSAGGNLASTLNNIFSSVLDDTSAGGSQGGGATVSPAFQRLLDSQQKTGEQRNKQSEVLKNRTATEPKKPVKSV